MFEVDGDANYPAQIFEQVHDDLICAQNVGTKEYVTKKIQEEIRRALSGFIGQKTSDAVEKAREAIMKALPSSMPVGTKVEVVEEDEDTKIIREIMEEPNDVITIRAQIPQPPIEFIRLTIKIDK